MVYSTSKVNRFLLCILGLMFGVFCTVNCEQALAQSEVGIIHTPPTADEIPPPGEPYEMIVVLTNTQDTTLELSTNISIDGKLVQLAPVLSRLDEWDRPLYRIQINAPLAQMSYKFLLKRPDGTIITTQSYKARRECIPEIKIAYLKESGDGKSELSNMMEVANRLEVELDQYEQVHNLINEINSLLGERK